MLFFSLVSVYALTSQTVFGSDNDEVNKSLNQTKGSGLSKSPKKDVVLKNCLSSPNNPKTIKRRKQRKEKKVHFDLGKNVVHTVPRWDRRGYTPSKINNKNVSSSNVPDLNRGPYVSSSKNNKTAPWYYTLQEKIWVCIVFLIVCVVMIYYGFCKKGKKKKSRSRSKHYAVRSTKLAAPGLEHSLQPGAAGIFQQGSAVGMQKRYLPG